MDNPYKLLVIDIDGTLINSDGDISADNREALTLVRRRGIQVSLSTGRSLKSSLGIINQLSLESCHIFFDGALAGIPGTGEEIYIRTISGPMVRQMVDFARLHDVDLELFSSEQYFAERETWSTEAHRRFFGVEPVIVDFTEIQESERIIKGGLVVTGPREEAKAEDFSKDLSESLYFSGVKVPSFPGVTFINILAPGTSKGRALEAMVSHLGISLAEVVAVGDGQNDISLLSAAGLGIAMGNAHTDVKNVADHITLDVEEHGLAAAIKEFLV